MKIITIIGARPQIIKAAAISRQISNYYAKSNRRNHSTYRTAL